MVPPLGGSFRDRIKVRIAIGFLEDRMIARDRARDAWRSARSVVALET